MRRLTRHLHQAVSLLALVAVLGSRSAPLATLADIWGDVALQAAEVTAAAIQKQTGLEFSLRDVPLETLGVYVGRQHHLSVDLDGRQFELVLHDDDATAQRQADDPALRLRSLPPAAAAAAAAAAPQQAVQGVGGLPLSAAGQRPPPSDPFRWQRQRTRLPEVTLAGPVELVLQQPTPLTLFLPHLTEAPPTQRLLVGPGVVVTLQQLRGISLRKPVDMPKLPPSYLAEVFAHQQLGDAEPGSQHAPGILYLADQLYRTAANASLGLGADGQGGAREFLVSFDIEPARDAAAVTVLSAAPPGGTRPQQLRARRLSRGAVEVVLRQRQDQEAAAAEARAAAAPGGLSPGAAAPGGLWAWPLPAAVMSEWARYEAFLRSLAVGRPVHKALKEGLALRLRSSSIEGVNLIKFDMQLKGGAPPGVAGIEALLPPEATSVADQGSLEVWEALVEVKERADGAPGVEYVPISTKRKHAFHSTLSLSPGGWLRNVSRA